MHHKPKPPQEIAPNHWIEPPIYATAGTSVPQDVRDANHAAAIQINEHKDNFLRVCLESLFSDEEVSAAMLTHINDPTKYIPALIAKLDPTKLRLTLRDDFSPTLIIPSHHHPDSKKQKGVLRHTGHTLTFSYDDRWLGTMTVEYNNGRINIDMTTNQEAPEP